MAFQTIEVTPLTGAMGAQISGVDLSQSLSNQTWDEIHQAWLDNLMVCFRNQSLEPEAHLALARRFGKPAIYPFIEGVPGYPEVTEILKTENDQKNFGGSWHSDTTYKEKPDLGTLLYAHEVPKRVATRCMRTCTWPTKGYPTV